jgi:TonB family protein
MDRCFAVCIVALSLGASVVAQEPAVTRAEAGVAAAPSPFAGPSIQFDDKGVDFKPWLKSFVAKVRRNWFVPLAAQSIHGRVVITFVVQRNGAITDVVALTPSDVETFNRSALNAIVTSGPVEALPASYPDDSAKFTITFTYNETPVAQAAQSDPAAR